MKNLSKMMVATAVACVGVFTCNAKTLYWGGATTGTWEVGNGGAETGGWQLDDGTPAIFENGDSVTFGSQINGTQTNACTITLKGDLIVGAFLFDSESDYTLKATKRGTDGVLAEATSFIKRGSGVMYTQLFEGRFTCPMRVEKGWIEDKEGAASSIGSTIFGDLTKDRTITIGCGDPNVEAGVRRLNGSGSLMGTTSQTPTATFIFDGGRLRNRGSYSNSTYVFGPLILRNGARIYKEAQMGYFVFNDDIRIERGTVFERSKIEGAQVHNSGKFAFGAGAKKPITIYVEDVTNADPDAAPDDETDFYFDGVLQDYAGADSGWIKRGPGIMQIQIVTEYTGDVDIQEGEVYLSNQYLGKRIDDHSIFVREDTVLRFGSGCGSFSGDKPTWNLIVTNGTVKIDNGIYLAAGNLHLYGSGKIEYANGYHDTVGVIGFGGYNRFETDESYIFPGNRGNAFCSLDYRDSMESYTWDELQADGTTKTYNGAKGYTVFDVKPAKTRTLPIADLQLSLEMRNSHNQTKNWAWPCGVKKMGDGVMEYTAAWRWTDSRGGVPAILPTLIREGGFVIGPQAALLTNVVVSSGAYVGGNGRVGGKVDNNVYNPADLIIEEGGGFLFDATNVNHKLIVSRDVILPTKGIIKIYNLGETKIEEIDFANIPLPQATHKYQGLVDGESQWKVLVDGHDKSESKHVKVTFDLANKTYSMKYNLANGLKVIVR